MIRRLKELLLARLVRELVVAGHVDELMLEVVRVVREVRPDESYSAINEELSTHLRNAVSYEFQTLEG